MSPVPTIDPDEVAAGTADGVLLDVREIDEWLAGHMHGAVHIPLMELPQRIDELPRDHTIVCICRSGNRSGQATAFLIDRGVAARNMVGGMKAWAAAGLPVERLDGSAGLVI